VAVMATAAA